MLQLNLFPFNIPKKKRLRAFINDFTQYALGQGEFHFLDDISYVDEFYNRANQTLNLNSAPIASNMILPLYKMLVISTNRTTERGAPLIKGLSLLRAAPETFLPLLMPWRPLRYYRGYRALSNQQEGAFNQVVSRLDSCVSFHTEMDSIARQTSEFFNDQNLAFPYGPLANYFETLNLPGMPSTDNLFSTHFGRELVKNIELAGVGLSINTLDFEYSKLTSDDLKSLFNRIELKFDSSSGNLPTLNLLRNADLPAEAYQKLFQTQLSHLGQPIELTCEGPWHHYHEWLRTHLSDLNQESPAAQLAYDIAIKAFNENENAVDRLEQTAHLIYLMGANDQLNALLRKVYEEELKHPPETTDPMGQLQLTRAVIRGGANPLINTGHYRELIQNIFNIYHKSWITPQEVQWVTDHFKSNLAESRSGQPVSVDFSHVNLRASALRDLTQQAWTVRQADSSDNPGPFIKELYLVNVGLNKSRLNVLLQSPLMNFRTLKVLDLSRNSLNGRNGLLAGNAMSHLNKWLYDKGPHTQLHTLCLRRLGLENKHLNQLIEGIKQVTSLKIIDVRHNRLSSDDVQSAYTAINPSITELHWYWDKEPDPITNQLTTLVNHVNNIKNAMANNESLRINLDPNLVNTINNEAAVLHRVNQISNPTYDAFNETQGVIERVRHSLNEWQQAREGRLDTDSNMGELQGLIRLLNVLIDRVNTYHQDLSHVAYRSIKQNIVAYWQAVSCLKTGLIKEEDPMERRFKQVKAGAMVLVAGLEIAALVSSAGLLTEPAKKILKPLAASFNLTFELAHHFYEAYQETFSVREAYDKFRKRLNDDDKKDNVINAFESIIECAIQIEELAKALSFTYAPMFRKLGDEHKVHEFITQYMNVLIQTYLEQGYWSCEPNWLDTYLAWHHHQALAHRFKLPSDAKKPSKMKDQHGKKVDPSALLAYMGITVAYRCPDANEIKYYAIDLKWDGGQGEGNFLWTDGATYGYMAASRPLVDALKQQLNGKVNPEVQLLQATDTQGYGVVFDNQAKPFQADGLTVSDTPVNLANLTADCLEPVTNEDRLDDLLNMRSIRHKIKELNQRMNRVETTVDQLSSQMADRNQTIREQADQISQLQTDNRQKEARINQLETDNEKHRAEFEKLKWLFRGNLKSSESQQQKYSTQLGSSSGLQTLAPPLNLGTTDSKMSQNDNAEPSGAIAQNPYSHFKPQQTSSNDNDYEFTSKSEGKQTMDP